MTFHTVIFGEQKVTHSTKQDEDQHHQIGNSLSDALFIRHDNFKPFINKVYAVSIDLKSLSKVIYVVHFPLL